MRSSSSCAYRHILEQESLVRATRFRLPGHLPHGVPVRMQGSPTCPISATASIFTAQWPDTARSSGVSDFMTDERRLRPAAICGAHKPHVLAQLVDQKLAVAAPCARASCHGRSIRSEYAVVVVVDRCWPRPSDMEACSRLTRSPARPAATRSAAQTKQKVNVLGKRCGVHN